ncbi:hypothetical protein AB1N83_000614 [Pleurotus pulmonarius]
MGSFSQSCCFCLSLRFGTMVISTISLLAGFALLVVSGYSLSHISSDAGWYQKFLLWLHVVMYIFLGTFGLVGLVGAMKQRFKLIAAFYPVLLTDLTFHISMGIITLRDLFSDGGRIAISKCVKATTDQAIKDRCPDEIARRKKMTIPLLIAFWIIHAYGVFVVYQYQKQLKRRDNKEEGQFLNSDIVG